MIKIQLYESSSKKEIQVIKDNPEREEFIQIYTKRSWQPIINLLQTEDEKDYGTQFRSIPQFINYHESSCFTWVVFAMLSRCQELWG